MPILTYDQLLEMNARLMAELESVIGENKKLQAIVLQQAKRIKELEQEVGRLKRRSKRQAAPFSKGSPTSKPRKPGRKPGKDYGRVAQRPVPERRFPSLGSDVPEDRFAVVGVFPNFGYVTPGEAPPPMVYLPLSPPTKAAVTFGVSEETQPST